MPCEVNVIPDIPLSASMPGDNDLMIWTLPDGTSVVRKYSTFKAGNIQLDKEIVVTASGGTINNLQSTFTITDYVGKRVRVYRNGIKQTLTIVAEGSYYSFNSATGAFSITPNATTGEIFQFEEY